MKVKGTQPVDIEISEREERRIVHEWLKKRFDISSGHGYATFIRDGKLVESVECSAGSHSYDEEIILRDATAADAVILDLIHETRM
jgi:hypothetical protein